VHMLLPERVGTMSPAGVADAYAWPESDRPWVRAVMVATADGAARSPQGRSGGISSAGDRLVFGTIRGLSDVILVGADTFRLENYGPVRLHPALAKRRAEQGMPEVPRLAVVTSSGRLDETAPVFTEAPTPPLLLVPGTLPADRRAALEPVAEIVEIGTESLDLHQGVAELAQRGLNRITVEGGPRLLGQLAALGLMDELCLTVTPLMSGGAYNGEPVPRILDGTDLPDPPRSLHLAHAIEDAGTLFLRYTTE
jgi:riboflavin biosynthesis pyrimidine reductase